MAAVTVAGQCRERSPGDLALFGSDAVRFAERFADPAAGEAMLAEAVRDGVAEREAVLSSRSGEATFQVSLWRQRGGERIRLIACFAHLPEPQPEEMRGAGLPPERVEAFADQFRLPLSAIAGLAERLRHGGGNDGDGDAPLELAGDILAASWRLTRLVDDLVLMAELDGDGPPLRMSEVDVARLSRRVLRLAQPMAAAADVALEHDLGRTSGPSVLADETTLWSAIETIVRAAVAASGQGGAVRIHCGEEAGDLVLSVEGRGRGAAKPAVALGPAEAMGRANGAHVHVATDDGFVARLTFPKERCLNPI